MCINRKRFYNKWLHSWQWSDCGHCPSCLQAKANKRTMRIKSALYKGYVQLLVTLTYRNINIPYIRKDEIKENSPSINIYRDCSVRRVRIKGDYSMAYKYNRQKEVVSVVDCFEKRIFPDASDVRKLPKLRGQQDRNKVGVLLFKDVQDFEKRLRINLKRRYGISLPIFSFKCSEYGPSTFRPHFHLLISVPSCFLAECKSAIIQAWPYDSRIKSAKSIEIARNASSYVSSYVNRGADFPAFLGHKSFLPKHSFSKGYGTTCSAYSLENLLKAFRRGDITFDPNLFGQKSDSHDVLFPTYACNKYFAKCYGYSRLSYDEILGLCKCPEEFLSTSDVLPRMFLSTDENTFTGLYDYDFKKINATISLIKRLRSRFLRDFVYYENGVRYVGLPENEFNYELFGDYYYRFWSVYASTLNKHKYDKAEIKDIPFIFENWDEVYKLHLRSDILSLVDYSQRSTLENPNLFKRIVIRSFDLNKTYLDRYKRRKVTNCCMANSGFNV